LPLLPDETREAAAYAEFVADLRCVRQMMELAPRQPAMQFVG
jgi:hypothetical protein